MRGLKELIVPFKNRVRYNRFFRGLATCMMVSVDFPAVIGVDPTNICNLKCTFCGPATMKDKKGRMEMALYERLLNQCRGQRKLWMLMLHNFGEPLLNPDIAEMVRLAKKKDITRSINFSTNGTLLTEAMARDLITAGLDGLVISVDAYSRDQYKELKGRDCLDQVEANARTIMGLKSKMKRSNPHVSAKMVRRRGFEDTFNPFLKKWSAIVDEAALTPFSNWGDRISDPQAGELGDKRYACHFLWYYPAISWDGRVFFCCAACDKEAVIGNLNESSLAEIWKGTALRAVRQAHLEKRFDEIKSCRRCTYWAESRINLDWYLKAKQGTY